MVSEQGAKWRIPDYSLKKVDTLSEQLSISPVLAQLLVNRGITSCQEAQSFLFPSWEALHSPWLMNHMEDAVKTLEVAINHQALIVVYGDYDADGITATALLVEFLNTLGARCTYFIPDRFEHGYGLAKNGIDAVLAKFPAMQLMITVDCGINAYEEIDYLKSQGIQVVVTDHHEPLTQLPQDIPVLNPKLKNSNYPFHNLAGVGVAMKLCQAFEEFYYSDQEGRENSLHYEFIDLVTVGTVADLVPLKGENRIMVTKGLDQVTTRRPGFRAIAEMLNLSSDELTTGQIGFLIAPRLNAAGRLASAEEAVELLLTRDEQEAKKLAQKLDWENRERQEVEKKILREAEDQIEREQLLDQGPVLMLYGKHWHEGVIGIVASRILDKHFRPVIVLTEGEGKVLKGSCRSIPGFNIAGALKECDKYLEKYGGHEQAAGLSIAYNQLEHFRFEINNVANRWLTSEDFIPTVHLDALLPEECLNADLVREIDLLAPYGIGNPSPLMGCENMTVKSLKNVGSNGNHLKIKFKTRKTLVDGIWFKSNYPWENIDKKQEHQADVVFSPRLSFWNSSEGDINLHIEDMRPKCPNESSEVLDYRGKDKLHVLKSLHKKKFFPIILVNTGQIKQKLQEEFPAFPVYRVTDIRAQKPHMNTPELASLIIFDLPYDPEYIQNWINYTGTRQVYLLYNEKDRAKNETIWRANIPHEEDIKYLIQEGIKLIDANLKKKQHGHNFNDDLSHWVKKCMGLTVSSRWIRKSIKILEELNYIRNDEYNERWEMLSFGEQINGNGNEEPALRNSATYQEEKQLLTQLKYWEYIFTYASESAMYMLLYRHEFTPEQLYQLYSYYKL